MAGALYGGGGGETFKAVGEIYKTPVYFSRNLGNVPYALGWDFPTALGTVTHKSEIIDDSGLRHHGS